jgi:hypothetical protein
LTPEQEQQKLFEEASNVVSVQGFYMKRCLVSSFDGEKKKKKKKKN